MPSDYAQLVLQFAWVDPEAILAPPPETADAVLRIAITPGGLFSPVLSVYQEMSTLLNLCQIASGLAQWPSNDSSEYTELHCPLVSQVDSFLEEVASPLLRLDEVTVISPTANHTVYEPRTDLDFTERIWMFSKDAQSLEDLQQAFATVFKSMLLGKVQPFLHRSSSSLLSSLFRQVLLCTSNDERHALAAKFQSLLSEHKLLNCLVEIGLEKLQRDYKSFFVGSDLATSSQLDCFLASGTESLLEKCYSLCKLYSVLELNAAALSFLSLPTSTLSSLTKIALEVYRTRTFEGLSDISPVFHLPLPAFSQPLKSVVSLCSNLIPSVWSLSSQDDQPHSAETGISAVSVVQCHPLLTTLEGQGSTEQWIHYRSHCVSLPM